MPKKHKIRTGQQIDLSNWSSADTSGFAGDKTEAQERLLALNTELSELQEKLYAQHRHKILVILQGMDTSGKDGTVKHVFRGVNPLGIDVYSFKKPSEEELERDYLWRIHQKVPRQGHIAIFNRSHYEDVLVPRVEGWIEEKVWMARYRQMIDFERMLCEEGTVIFKFFLHISADEQKERLENRLQRPDKHWKFHSSDFDTRKKWSLYQEAYEDIFQHTSSEHAPWYLIPADKKWYRNLVVSEILIDRLKALSMDYPEPPQDIQHWKVPPIG